MRFSKKLFSPRVKSVSNRLTPTLANAAIIGDCSPSDHQRLAGRLGFNCVKTILGVSPIVTTCTATQRDVQELKRKSISNQNAEKPRVRKLGSLVNQLMARRGYAQGTASEEMLRLIVAEVGSEIGDGCSVGKLRAGVLQIYACDSATLQELNFRRRMVLKRLQNDMPAAKISDIRFKILAS